jgi:hypothetical protein
METSASKPMFMLYAGQLDVRLMLYAGQLDVRSLVRRPFGIVIPT